MNYISSLNTSNLQQSQDSQHHAQIQLQQKIQQGQLQQQQQQHQDNLFVRSKSIPLSSNSEELKNLIIASTHNNSSINNTNHSSMDNQLDSNKMTNQYTTDGQNLLLVNSSNVLSPTDTSNNNMIPSNSNGQMSSHNSSNTLTTNTAQTSVSSSNIQQLASQSEPATHPSSNTTASLFPFHNAFDINAYPVTNPPIFDSTVVLPYYSNEGVPRRRRISISNGQIGQIISHEAFFDNENPNNPLFDDDEFTFNQQHHNQHQTQDDSHILNQQFQQHLQFQPQQQPQQTLLAHTDASTLPIVPVKQEEIKASVPVDPLANAAGVPPPNHQLIYNNEVIFSTNNGPIPGTAAWKKERLLERNRIAASKCRQRKKQAHIQLQDNVGKMERQLVERQIKINSYEKLVKRYNDALKAYFAKGGSELSELKKFVNIKKIEDIKDML
ncbi:hypothetical protein DFJ63DRAFT_207106 [Scheffersomyces coipomensis]|uniref:uncharacterized protein n=1 Tax=Scheffersomyces coipomensis TaxID=1788519 RepID=UPI00315DA8AB